MTVQVTVGVVTHDRSVLFANMLEHLKATIRACRHSVAVLIVNNSGADSHRMVSDLVEQSGLSELCPTTVVDSPENNIATGRNVVIDHCRTRLLAFIDDDEYPRLNWLTNLVDQQLLGLGDMVAGPTLPVYPKSAAAWVKEIDLHNVRGRKTGDVIRRSGSGNCLLDLEAIGEARFDHAFGLTGGEDANFFESLTRRGHKLVWCAEAVVDESITEDRSTVRYSVFRFIKQGNNFSRLMLVDASLGERVWFRARGAVLALVGIVCGALLLPFSPRGCARCWKGGFTNLGKLVSLRDGLYG